MVLVGPDFSPHDVMRLTPAGVAEDFRLPREAPAAPPGFLS